MLFNRLKHHFDPGLLAQREIALKEDLFDKSPRTTYPGSAHREVEDIIIRGPAMPLDSLGIPIGDLDISMLHNTIHCMPWPFEALLPRTSQAVIDMLAAVTDPNKEVGRVIVTRLQPSGTIYLHRDEGAVPEYYTRIHCVLQGSPGNVFWCGDEFQSMLTGEVWEIDVREPHHVINGGMLPRIHVIVDVER